MWPHALDFRGDGPYVVRYGASSDRVTAGGACPIPDTGGEDLEKRKLIVEGDVTEVDIDSAERMDEELPLAPMTVFGATPLRCGLSSRRLLCSPEVIA